MSKDYWNHAERIDPGIKLARERAVTVQARKKAREKALKDNRKKRRKQ